MGDDDAKARNADIFGLPEPETHSGDVQSAGPAVCVRCSGLFLPTRSASWWQFLCIYSPRRATYNAVLGHELADPPYYKCRDINPAGFCKLYREGVNDYQPREFPS